MPIHFSDISRMSLFRKFNESFVRLLDSFFLERSYPAGKRVIEQGVYQNNFFIILAGEVEVYTETEGKKIILNTLMAGQFFGEINLFDPGVAAANVRSLTPLRTLEISNEDFRNFLTQKPELAADFTFQLATTICKQVRQSHDTIQRELLKPRSIQMGEEFSPKRMQA